jgi:hypothetical protein
MFTLEGPHIVMSRTDAQNGLDFHFKLAVELFWNKFNSKCARGVQLGRK